jgi:hypothetical protein
MLGTSSDVAPKALLHSLVDANTNAPPGPPPGGEPAEEAAAAAAEPAEVAATDGVAAVETSSSLGNQQRPVKILLGW